MGNSVLHKGDGYAARLQQWVSLVKDSSIAGPAGALQVLEEKTVPEPVAVAVICHPHPLHGGALTNKVVHQLAKTFNDMGAVSVRFNFRGVGESEGEYDEGRGELEDLVAISRWAGQRWQGLPFWLAGFSFGAFIALKGAQRLEPRRLVTVAPAVNYFPAEPLHLPGLDWLLIQGENDDIVPASEVRKWLESLESQPKFVLIEGAGHFFHGRLNALRQALIDAF